MADETEISEEKTSETVTETAATDTVVETETTATETVKPDPIAVEREARIRAEERARVLEEQLAVARATKPAEPPKPEPKPYTAEDVQAAFDKNQITDAQRIQYLADLQVQTRLREQSARDQAARIEASLKTKYNAYLTRYPNLLTPGDPTVQQVWADVALLAEEEGLDPADKRTQLRAMERILGALKGTTTMPTPDPTRRRIPTGTGYGNPTPPPAKPTADLKGVPEHIVAGWRRLGANLEDPKVVAFYRSRWDALQSRRGARMTG